MSIFSHTSLIADLLYTTAIFVFPIVILLLYISSSIVAYIESTNFNGYTGEIAIQIITSLLSTLFAYIPMKITLKAYMERYRDAIERARDSESISLLNAKRVYKSGYYDYMLIELNNAIEKSLYAKLATTDSIENNRSISFSRLIKFAEQQKLINATEKALIEEVRNLKNQVAHGTYNLKLDEDKAKQLLDDVITLTSQLSKI
ncbi:HEPN domain-containing protein [uncultured Methanomethylovorans sp.]|uniref:HEPN domain-containing protein n=1 Tax=uncultured Methanomethylovorans sp. TaxID=183759 RepID=UPI002AA6B6C3|nr:HEPN domain-containing protein [uncultured Methanomethylovorans sp.]